MTIQFPEHLSRFHAKLADAATTQVNIACWGDSVTEGAYANDGGGGDAASSLIWRNEGWVGQVRQHFADDYGYPGEGWIAAPSPGVYTYTSVATGSSGLGPFSTYILIDDSATHLDFTTPACTGVRVWSWWTGGPAISWSVDGGAYTGTGPTMSGADTLYHFDITGLPDTAHDVVLSRSTEAGAAFVVAIGPIYPEVAGVLVHRVAKSGQELNDLSPYFTSITEGSTRRLASALMMQPDLVIIAFSATSVTRSAGRTPEQLAAGTEQVVDYVTATGADVLLLGGPIRDPTTYSTTYTQDQYDDAVLGLAATKPNVAALDLKDDWVSWADANALGYYHDSVHPSSLGHIDMGQRIYDAITTDGGGTAPSSTRTLHPVLKIGSSHIGPPRVGERN